MGKDFYLDFFWDFSSDFSPTGMIFNTELANAYQLRRIITGQLSRRVSKKFFRDFLGNREIFF